MGKSDEHFVFALQTFNLSLCDGQTVQQEEKDRKLSTKQNVFMLYVAVNIASNSEWKH